MNENKNKYTKDKYHNLKRIFNELKSYPQGTAISYLGYNCTLNERNNIVAVLKHLGLIKEFRRDDRKLVILKEFYEKMQNE